MKRYVIVGGGAAAVGCLEGIRSVDAEGSVVMLSGEDGMPYCRPLLSYYLQGKTSLERMKYRPDGFYAANRCEMRRGRAVRIDPDDRVVTLSDGRRVAYDALCVATGSSPAVPPLRGLDGVRSKCCFTTLRDALTLEATVTPASRVLIVGAGLIGLKCAEGLTARAKAVTVCDTAPGVLSSVLDAPCAARMQRRLEDYGVQFLLSDAVERVSPDRAFMRGGAEVRFDWLVLATGVRPNVSLVRDAGGVTESGIVVDASMRSSIDGVFAAGDCAQGDDASVGEKRVLAILPNAVRQGRCAGVNMAGGSVALNDAIPLNAVGFFGLHALAAGARVGTLVDASDPDTVRQLYVQQGLLKGFVLMGDVSGAGIYTALIRERTPLDSVHFDLLKKAPSLAAFSSQYRDKRLGGVV